MHKVESKLEFLNGILLCRYACSTIMIILRKGERKFI